MSYFDEIIIIDESEPSTSKKTAVKLKLLKSKFKCFLKLFILLGFYVSVT
jgi:hypothetical protein